MKNIAIPAILSLSLSLISCDQKESSSGENTPSNESTAPKTSKHEQLANEIMDAMSDLSDAATEAKDLDSAKAAAKKIDDIGKRFATIAQELESMTPPSDDIKKAITEKMEARDEEMQTAMEEKFDKAMQALDPEAQQVIMQSMGKFFEQMQASAPVFEKHFDAEPSTEE